MYVRWFNSCWCNYKFTSFRFGWFGVILQSVCLSLRKRSILSQFSKLLWRTFEKIVSYFFSSSFFIRTHILCRFLPSTPSLINAFCWNLHVGDVCWWFFFFSYQAQTSSNMNTTKTIDILSFFGLFLLHVSPFTLLIDLYRSRYRRHYALDGVKSLSSIVRTKPLRSNSWVKLGPKCSTFVLEEKKSHAVNIVIVKVTVSLLL